MGKSSFMSKANWSADKPKNSVVETPQALCDFLAGQVLATPFNRVVDVGCNQGNLSSPYLDSVECLGIDVEDFQNIYPGKFYQSNFLDISKEEVNPKLTDIIVCNPPFNQGKHKIPGRKFLPEVFLDKMLDLWGMNLRVMLFCPMGFRLNQRKKSVRWRKFRDGGLQITSICSLPLDVFPGIQFHAEVLFIGDFCGLPPHMFLPDEALL